MKNRHVILIGIAFAAAFAFLLTADAGLSGHTPVVTEHAIDAVSYYHQIVSTPAGKSIYPFRIGRQPPLANLMAAFIIGVAGSAPAGLIGVKVLFLFALFCGVLKLGSLIKNGRAGFTGCLLTAGWLCFREEEINWFSYSFLREYLLELPLAAAMVWALYFLIRSDRFARRRYALLFGLTVALGMLVKWTFPMYIAPAFCYLAWRIRRDPARRANCARVLGLAGLIAGPVYGALLYYNRGNILGYFSENISLASARELGMSSLMISPAGWWYYPAILPELMSPFLLAVFLIALAASLRWRLYPELTATVIGSYILLSLMPSECLRHLVPVLPICALIAGAGCAGASPKTLNQALVLAVAVISLSLVAVHFGLLPAVWPLSRSLRVIPPPERQRKTVIRRIIGDIGDQFEERRIPLVAVLPDDSDFRGASFLFWSLSDNRPLGMSPSWRVDDGDWRAGLEAADFVVAASGLADREHPDSFRAEAARELAGPDGAYSRQFQLVRSYPLGESESALLYRRRSPREDFLISAFPPGPYPPPLAVFQGEIALLDFRVERESGRRLRLGYRWLCLAPPTNSYKFIAHFKSDQGDVFDQDHLPALGSYPTFLWRRNEIIKEEYVIELPPAAPPATYQVWVGVWNGVVRLPAARAGEKVERGLVNAGEIILAE